MLKFVFITAITGPSCEPGCGKNAHCEYGLSNKCVCNSGTIGNPYEACEEVGKKMCEPNSCGTNAECRDSYNGIECYCRQGFTGNAYISCDDINECGSDVCGSSAVCINTIGSYDCRCKEGYAGNPFIMCAQVHVGICKDAENCLCNDEVICPGGYSCTNGKCVNACENIRCGPKATCDNGQCLCPAGYVGNPKDLVVGCKVQGQCHSDNDCYDSEICFQLGKGLRKCVDACSKVQCGPNALCVAENHRSTCICAPDYIGNPGDLSLGCQLEETKNIPGCKSDDECEFGTICSVDIHGQQKCISPCETVACGSNEVCQLDIGGHPTCACKREYIWNPVTSACEKPTTPDCKIDSDCQQIEACQPDALGVLKCVAVCSHFTCPNNAACIAENHKGKCQCLAGFTGNPNDRNGCKPIVQNQCTSDAQCKEHETCRTREHGVSACVSACEQITCGPNAVCVVNNHAAQCQCPPGSFVGDPHDPTVGCRDVPCVYNIDCPDSQLCNRLTHTCYDVCDEESCGTNAVCIAKNHKASCQCPPGFAPNPIPDVECIQLDGCSPNPCHPSALCESTPSGHTCRCPPETVGDPITSGCRPKGNCPRGDIDCPDQSVCLQDKCVNPCDHKSCGNNAVCTVENRKAVCTCPLRYVPSPNGCVRMTVSCSSDKDCGNEVCYGGQCRAACRDNNDCSSGERCLQNKCMTPCSDHSQCRDDQACVNSTCVIGCRSNKFCPSEYACVNNICQDPCKLEGFCGPNAICSCAHHKVECKCPNGFQGTPTAEEGCIRIPSSCLGPHECLPGYDCIGNICTLPCKDNTVCAQGERCSENTCVKVCYGDSNCLTGEVCQQGVCRPGCQTDTDCRASEVCLEGQCKCALGYIGTPTGCVDINECEDSPCHPSAACINQPGSFTCACPEGRVGDPFVDGCRLPGQCRSDKNCADNLICKIGKCQNPCEETRCGNLAICNVTNHKLTCTCPPGHLGDPHDKRVGCFKVECLEDEECPSNRFCDTRSNKCLSKSITFFLS